MLHSENHEHCDAARGTALSDVRVVRSGSGTAARTSELTRENETNLHRAHASHRLTHDPSVPRCICHAPSVPESQSPPKSACSQVPTRPRRSMMKQKAFPRPFFVSCEGTVSHAPGGKHGATRGNLSAARRLGIATGSGAVGRTTPRRSSPSFFNCLKIGVYEFCGSPQVQAQSKYVHFCTCACICTRTRPTCMFLVFRTIGPLSGVWRFRTGGLIPMATYSFHEYMCSQRILMRV